MQKINMKRITQLLVSIFIMVNAISSYAARLMIFVSHSMSDSNIASYIIEANQFHGSVLLRGLVGKNLQSSHEFVANVIKLIPNHQGGLAIDPTLYQRFDITKVPAIVVEADAPCLSNMSCIAPAFDVVYGNVSLEVALKKIIAADDPVSASAKSILNSRGTHA